MEDQIILNYVPTLDREQVNYQADDESFFNYEPSNSSPHQSYEMEEDISGLSIEGDIREEIPRPFIVGSEAGENYYNL